MQDEQTLPRHPRRSEKYNVALLDGSGEVLERMAAKAGFDGVGPYLRALAEREIKALCPEDFKRLRGVG